ncbi:MAG: NERD domain-containing protein [Chloroflexia bacterium]|nr:NERD domain-containing protein [Chloroflexia bacterium]
MTVQVWVGEIPEHPQEREAIVALARGLARLDELYLILASFTVGGQAVDLAIFKPNGGFVIELKHCDGRVIGGVNGRWRVIDANGEEHLINPDRRNPYNQVISYFYRLSNFLNQHRRNLFSRHRAASVDFRTSKRLVVISPSIHPDSEVILDWKVDLKGLDELPTYLVTATSSEISLTEDELLGIPQLLRCEPWHDVNLLVGEGGLVEEGWPTPEEAALIAEEEEIPQPAAEETPEAGALPRPAPRPWAIWMRRTALLLAVLLLVGVVAGFFSGTWERIWAGLQPTPTPTPTLSPTPIVLPTIPPAGDQTPVPLVYYVDQSVTRESAFANGEVEVTLRRVEFLPSRITFYWALVNRGTRSVRLPLDDVNISVRDNVGNEYRVDPELSLPQRVLVAWPKERVEGFCVVPRPVSPDAITMVASVNGEPFEGKPVVWLLNIPGRE